MASIRALASPRRLILFVATLCCTIFLVSRFWDFLKGKSATSNLPKRRDLPVQGCPADSSHKDNWLTAQTKREKAAILLLARDDDLEQLIPTLQNFEQSFNARFRYPYVFLNEAGLSNAFMAGVKDTLPKDAVVEFGVIPQEHWSIPDWIDKDRARESFKRMKEDGIQYGDREGYHHMCRYYSGLFALHPLLLQYDFYWRLEPGVRYFCEMQYDPFLFMSSNNKVYGWFITIVETPNTIPTLFNTLLDWRSQIIANNTAANRFGKKLQLADWEKPRELWDFFVTNVERTQGNHFKNREEYNLCHFWTNGELGDLRFFRSAEYQSLFNHLDASGGFYYERWGDAPIRSLALGLLAGFDKVHYFEDVAYKHDWFMHVPQDPTLGCKCTAPAWEEWTRDIDNDGWYSCLPRWRALDSDSPP